MKLFQILLYNFHARNFVDAWITSPESYACDITLRHAKTLGCTVVETTNAMVATEIKNAFEPLKMNVKDIQP
jgi:hypothetical protein